MGITDRKITSWTNPIGNEADQPLRSASSMKSVFDANSNQLKAALNATIDDLAATTGSSFIGSEAIAGLDGSTVKAQLVALMATKIASTGIKNMRIGNDDFLEYTLDGSLWLKAPTWGNVVIDPSGNAKNLTVTFEQAAALQNIASDESMAVLFGKLMKWHEGIVALQAGQSVQADDLEVIEGALAAAANTIDKIELYRTPLLTTGTAPDFIISPSPAWVSIPVNSPFTIEFHADGNAAKLGVTGVESGATKSIFLYGTKAVNVKAGQRAAVVYNGTSFFTLSASGLALPSPLAAGDVTVLEAHNRVEGTATSYAVKRTQTLKQGGIIRVTYNVFSSGSNDAAAKLQVNNVDVATSEIITYSMTDPLVGSKDITVNANDVLTLLLRKTSTSTAYSNFYKISIVWPEVAEKIAELF